MTLIDKARKLVEGILTIREDNVVTIMFEIPKVMSELNGMLYRLEHALEAKLSKRRELTRLLRAHYSGEQWATDALDRLPHKGKVPVSAMPSYIDTDEVMIELDEEISRLKVTMNAIERELKTVSSVQWIIRTYTDRMKYVK